MKPSENQQNVSSTQDKANTCPTNDAQPTQSSACEPFKKPHLKLFNCLMKPSLSLTSLPPQSPKEVSDEAHSAERPYNSLKKKRGGEKELWRRSWESQASISTTTSHTGTSGGKNGKNFWDAYNYIMDTNLIDSCREASGETNKARNDVTGELRSLKNNGDKMHYYDPSRSHGSSADPRRLRRWLREMEATSSKMPSITEAKKLNSDELKKFLLESADLYREISAHGRVVAACVRSLENSTRIDDQPKSLDSVEQHDSLDTIATTTSADSKRGENVQKALERRYHLLYLRAIEIQCMFESLLERRSYLQAIKDFYPPPIDTSDEEPVAKVPKFSFDTDYTPFKPSDDAKVTTESDADSEGSEGEMECVANGDCVDGTQIVPLKQATPPKTPSPNESFESPQGTVIKRVRPKDFSKFHRSNRKSKNCAIFYYKHVDDTDLLNTEREAEQPLVSSEASEEEGWEYTNTSEDVSPLTPDKDGLGDDLECLPLELSPENASSPQQPHVGIASYTTKLINTKESLRELVLEAESLVRQKINDRTSKTEYFFNEIIAKSQQQQRQKKMMEKSQKDRGKINRVQEWLKRHQETDGAIVVQPSPVTDCEASGEYTSEEEDHDTDTSEEITDSVATCCQLQGVDPLLTSTEGLGSETTPLHKVAMRTKSSVRRHSERPWSVSCLSQLTRNSRQSLIDAKMVETSTALANFSISESALHILSPQQYKNTSESDSKNCTRNATSTVNSVGSKNSLRRRRAKLRKKSYSSNKRSESGSEVPTSDVSRNILRTMAKSESFSMGTALMEDLSVAISMMTIVKDNQEVPQAQKPESDEEQKMMKPDFKIGSLTNVYANQSTNLGSLAALANYNHEKNDQDLNETGTENMSSFSENMWDNYIAEKYNSEAYSEDRDVDGAQRLLDFGDDYRNFIDSQSDCCSSLSAANIDSLSPPRPRKNMNGNVQNTSLSSNENSMKILRQRRIQELPEMERRRMSNGEDRKSVILEKLRHKALDNEASARRRSIQAGSRPLSYKSSSSDHSDNEFSDKNILKILAECKTNLERTEALRMANPQLLRPEDYEEILATCRKNVECLEAILKSGSGDPTTLKELIASWNNLLNWSENAAIARRLQEEIVVERQSLESISIDNGECLDTEEAIREKIHELNIAREDLQKHRSNMLKLNASVHSWLTRQEMQLRNELKVFEVDGNERTTQSDLRTFADDELQKFLKDEIVSLYAKWDSVNDRITLKLEGLNTSLVCWKQFENGLFEFQENLSKDRGALSCLKGSIEDGTAPDNLVNNVQQVSKLLSEKLENKIQQTISTNEDLLLHPEAALQFIASSNGSLSDSGISDGGFSELSERERRLNALKKIAKQLENALSPSSEVLKTITQRMESAENELKILQHTCRDLIARTTAQLLQQQGIAIPPNTNAQSQINVQIPIITIKGKSTKRSLPKRTKRKSPHSPSAVRTNAGAKIQTNTLNDDLSYKSESELDEVDGKVASRWRYLRRIVRMSVPVQLALVTLFCVACLLEPRCCDTLNNLSMSFTPQLRYVKGPPPT